MAPVNIFRHGADEEKAETARLVSCALAVCVYVCCSLSLSVCMAFNKNIYLKCVLVALSPPSLVPLP